MHPHILQVTYQIIINIVIHNSKSSQLIRSYQIISSAPFKNFFNAHVFQTMGIRNLLFSCIIAFVQYKFFYMF